MRPAQVRSNIRRLVRALAVGFAAGALALVVVGQPVARAQFSGVPGLVAYFNDQAGNAQIFTIAATGGAPTQLTHDSSNDVNPVWSPDGSKIAFESDRDGNYEIYVMNADGSNQTRLTTDPGSDVFPAWSPDGSKIAFASNRDGNYEIYVMNADGTAQTRLTTNPATDTTPSWSPDGSRIAFSSTRTGNGDIYVMNADGSNPVRLTTYAGEENGPDWSVTGNRIAFNRLPAGGGEFNILTMRADGSDLKQLSTRQDSSDPSWSPDDTHIVFDHSGTITTMSPTGTGLASLGVQGARPNWQPASSGLALTAPKAPGIETSMNLSGMLKLRNGSAAAQTIDVTVSAGGGPAQPLGHATTDSTGAFSLPYTPAAVGDYTFVASWAGDGSHQPAAASIDRTVTLRPAQLTLTASRHPITYGQSTMLTAHLAAWHANTTVTISQTPANGTTTQLISGTVDSHGNLSISVAPTKNTRYVLTWTGDDWYAAGSRHRTLGVRVVVKGKQAGYYAIHDHYHLYHYQPSCPTKHTDCPTYLVQVIPNHARDAVFITLERRTSSGHWRVVGTIVPRLSATSRTAAVFVYTSAVIGSSFRERAYFIPSNTELHPYDLPNTTHWSHFRVTR